MILETKLKPNPSHNSTDCKGQYENHHMCNGTLRFANGEIYVGELKDDMMHGHGVSGQTVHYRLPDLWLIYIHSMMCIPTAIMGVYGLFHALNSHFLGHM